MHIRWGSFHSDSFAIGNGVKQGGTLSPLFFNVYIDELSILRSEQHIGCCVGDAIVNHLSYADDMIIFSPSAKGLQKLLDICLIMDVNTTYYTMLPSRKSCILNPEKQTTHVL